MDGVGGTIKNVIFRKVKSGHVVVYTPNQFADAALKFVPSITTVYLPCTEEITEHGNIEQSPAIATMLSIHKFERYINKRGECSISFFKTAVDQEPFHTVVLQDWYRLWSRRIQYKWQRMLKMWRILPGRWQWMASMPCLQKMVPRDMFLWISLIYHFIVGRKYGFLFSSIESTQGKKCKIWERIKVFDPFLLSPYKD